MPNARESQGGWGYSGPAKAQPVSDRLKREVEQKVNALVEEALKPSYVLPPVDRGIA